MRYFKSCCCLDDNVPSPSQSANIDLDSATFAGIQEFPLCFLQSPESNKPFSISCNNIKILQAAAKWAVCDSPGKSCFLDAEQSRQNLYVSSDICTNHPAPDIKSARSRPAR
ncbi:hypothetical protein ACJ73_04618 [Blastomyces percursus]|uniref:Uncharacterized protein n=1 Tax=Blastomyces percursus TaxID=1658174 RepID=A0A1J9R688_9EURO|nr:hypothetical protein ACJ73_04618 [Blastomyces percursus]